MALEGTYEYECMRAELLGVEKPDYEEFIKSKSEREAAEKQAAEIEAMREEHAQQEEFQQVGGKLDELNNILKSTQKKINNFSAPFSHFIRKTIGKPVRGDISQATESGTAESTELERNPEELEVKGLADDCSPSFEQRERQVQSNRLPLLDNLIEKFDRAHTNMEYQNKQMKRVMLK